MRKGLGKLVMVAGLLALPLGAVAGGMSVYDSTEEPKANGARVQVSYPKGFDSGEAGYDEIRQFTRQSGELEEILILHAIRNVQEERVKMTLPVPGALPQKERYRLWKEQLGGKNKWLHEVRDTKADGRPAVFLAGADITRKKDKRHYSRIEVLSVYDGRDMLMLSCTVTGPEEKRAAVEKRYAKSRNTVCQPFLGSLRFMKRAEVMTPPARERMRDEILQMDVSGPGASCYSGSRR